MSGPEPKASTRPRSTFPLQETDSLASNVLLAYRTFHESQLELTQTAKHMAGQRDWLDAVHAAAIESMRRMYPDLDNETIQDVLEEAKPFYKWTSSRVRGEELNEEERKERTDEANTLITAFRDRLESMLPPGHANGCMAAVVDPLSRIPRSYRLRASLLISLVAEFDVLVSSLIREVFRMKPDKALKSKSFNWDQICAHEDLAALKENAIDEAVKKTMYGSFDNWLDKLSSYGVAISPSCRDPQAREVFQRRHLLVHNGGRASRAYVQSYGTDSEVESDGYLPVSEKYFDNVADKFLALGASLSVSVAAAFLKEGHLRVTAAVVGHAVYQLLEYRRYEAIVQVVSATNWTGLSTSGMDSTTRVNYWLALKRLGRFEECRPDVESWDVGGLPPQYTLARLALLDEFDEGLKLMEQIRGTEDLPLENWARWPLLHEFRRAEAQKSLQPQLPIEE